MKVRRRHALAGAVVALIVTAPLHAQAPADTTLAGAVSTFFADSLLDRLTSGPIVWVRGGGAFDQAVAGSLRAHPRFHGPVRGFERTFWLWIPAVTGEGDEARVTLEFGQDNGKSEGITFYVERREYVFAREGTGWRFVRSRRISHLDGGSVRG